MGTVIREIRATVPENGADSRGWRDDAVNAALAAESVGGEGLDALLRAIRVARPSCAVQTLWIDRARAVHFAEHHLSGANSLVAGSVEQEEEGASWLYVGWLGAAWDGQPVEIALPPGSATGPVVCIASDPATVRRLSRALADFAERPAGRCLAYSEVWRSCPALDAQVEAVTWDDVVLPASQLGEIRDAIEGFFGHREAFVALGFPWRRGILLIGPPGTGKTMIGRAAAAAIPELPFLYVRDLREYREREAIRAIFSRARKLAPCILTFEDLDGFINPANRSVFLNEIDGFELNDGLLIMASSNHPGKIDEALLKRPSRFDRVFHVGLPGLDERRKFCWRVLSRSRLGRSLAEDVDIERLTDQVAQQTKGFTPAYLKEALVAAALERAQKGMMQLDQGFAAAVLRQVHELSERLRRLKNPDALAELCGPETGLGFRHGLVG